MGDKRNEYTGLVEKLEGKSHLEELGLDERIILKMDAKEMECECVDDINQYRNKRWAVVGTLMNYQVT